MLEMLVSGFASVLNINIILLIFVGVVIGIAFGSVPGLTANMAVALFIPLTFGLEALEGLSILVGLYVGGISGGLISAILLNIPGTPASIATTFDGHPMAERGEAGKALGVGTVTSFIGTILGILALLFIAPSLAEITIKFGPIEYFSVSIFSLTMISVLSSGNMLKGIISGVLGIAISMVGLSPIDNVPRYTFGYYEFETGFALLPVMLGLYAVSEILKAAKDNQVISKSDIKDYKIKGLGFSLSELKSQIANIIRSAAIGIGLGVLPGIGSSTANLIAYSAAKNQSKYPEKFGTGIIDGIVASETSNNAVIGGAMTTLMTIGIPGDAVTAMLLGGFMIHGITPGPMLFKTNGELVYGIFAALILSAIFFLIIQMLGMRGFVQLLKIDKSILLPVVVTLCIVGSYATNNRMFDVICLAGFGAFGYFLDKLGFSSAPFVLGFILGPMVELNLRRGLMFTKGDFLMFFTRPIFVLFIAISIITIIIIAKKEYGRKKTEVSKN
ncbi:MAG: tripartite tricarboxylate transporter permease [Tissierellaceae bacterium]|nr:tripartite tricarboxylate transporter permease [Tissierellaceae bacterium]